MKGHDVKRATNDLYPGTGAGFNEKAQRIRLMRWYMALGAYGIVFMAVYLANMVGMDRMPQEMIWLFLLVGLTGNVVFGFLFTTHRNLKFKDPSLTLAQMLFSDVWGVIPLYFMPRARMLIILLILLSFTFGMLRLNLRDHIKVDLFIAFSYGSVLVAEYLRHAPGFDVQIELFQYGLTMVILAWFTFFGTYLSNLRHKLRKQNAEIQKANEEIRFEVAEKEKAQLEKDKLIVELREALGNVKTLSGLVPICSSCKKIRDDKGYWNQLEAYLRDHSDAQFSHGICPDCAKRLYPDYGR